jgi:hypothetical protein
VVSSPFPGATLLPVLRSQPWEAGKTALRSLLIRTEDELNHNLWVSFAYSEPSKLYTVTRESLTAHNQSGEALVMEAFDNLGGLGFEWEITSRRPDGTASVLTTTHEFAAESILVPDHLIEAQSILGAQQIAIAIPVAGLAIVQTANPVHRHELDQLMVWAHQTFMNAEGRTLTPNLVVAEMGKIQSMYCNPMSDTQLRDEAPSLHPEAYDEDQNTLAFRATSADLSLWEVQRLRDLLDKKELADGRPLKGLRVIAADLAQGQALSLHLSHLGIEVVIADDKGWVPFSN